MQNAGTWDSDLAILFLGCLLLPIGMYFLRACLEGFSSVVAAPAAPPSPSRPPYRSQPKTPTAINISFSLPNFKGWGTQPAKEASKRSPSPYKRDSNPKKREVPKTVSPLTSKAVEMEAISGLCNMGFKKGEASKVVKSLSSKTKYDSTESLIKDCFVCT